MRPQGKQVGLDTTNFTQHLSSAEDDVQKAMEVIDKIVDVAIRVVTDESEMNAAVTELNALGGGTIVLAGTITLTANRTWDLTNIVIRGTPIHHWSGVPTVRIDFNGFDVTFSGESCYFDNVAFEGTLTASATFANETLFKASEGSGGYGARSYLFRECAFINCLGELLTVGTIDLDGLNNGTYAKDVTIRYFACSMYTVNMVWNNNIAGPIIDFGTPGATNSIVKAFVLTHGSEEGQAFGRNRFGVIMSGSNGEVFWYRDCTIDISVASGSSVYSPVNSNVQFPHEILTASRTTSWDDTGKLFLCNNTGASIEVRLGPWGAQGNFLEVIRMGGQDVVIRILSGMTALFEGKTYNGDMTALTLDRVGDHIRCTLIDTNKWEIARLGPVNIDSLTEKTAPVAADIVVVEDSADTFFKKKVQIANLPSGASLGETWSFDATITDADPGSKNFRLDNATQGSATFIYVSDIAESGVDMRNLLLQLKLGDRLYMQQTNDPTRYHLFRATGASVGATNYVKVPVLADSSGVDLVDTEKCAFIISFSGVGAGATPPFDDTTAIVKGSADATKLVRIEADGLTTGVTRVLTMPDSDITPDDASASRTPTAHASSHQDAGGDEISVAGLSGQLADDQPALAHDLGGAKHNQDTLANLNTKVSDATLDDSGDPRDPNVHATSHQDAGGDEISVAGLSGQLADDQPALAHDLGGAKHNQDTLANLNTKISDAILDDQGSSRNPSLHNFGGSSHNPDTLANVNNKITDATLDDSGDPRDPNAHATSHQDAGGDEISVAGLSGLLADGQTPLAHKDTHKSGGGDAFVAADLLEAVVKRLRESGGPTDLTVGAVADGEYLKRSGSTVVGDTPVAVFGSEAEEASSDGESNTTQGTYQTKLTHTTVTLPAGKYRCAYSAEVTGGGSNDEVGWQWTVDGTTRGEGQYEPANANDYQAVGGFYYLTLGAPQTVALTIEYLADSGTAYIRRARVEIWRVG